MKRLARCILILILVTVLGAVGGYFYEDKTLLPMYTSTTQLYIVPGEENEATVRADNGGLKDDFVIIFKSNVVIQEAQKIAGTSENIAQYLTVASPANSNIVEITCTNPDQNTAKNYVDAVAKTALKTTSIIPVKSIQILSEGTYSNVPVKPDLYKNTAIIAAICAGICAVIELIIVLIICAFKTPEDNSDDELEYERYYGKYAALNSQGQMFIGEKNSDDRAASSEEKKSSKEKNFDSEEKDVRDILEDFDEDYAEDEEYSAEADYEEEKAAAHKADDKPDNEAEELNTAEEVQQETVEKIAANVVAEVMQEEEEEKQLTEAEPAVEKMTEEMMAQTEVVAEVLAEAAITQENDEEFADSEDWTEDLTEALEEENVNLTEEVKTRKRLHSSDRILGIINK